MSKAGEWEKMGDLIDDEMVEAFAIIGSAAEVAAEVVRRYSGLVDNIHLNLSDLPDAEARAAIKIVQAG